MNGSSSICMTGKSVAAAARGSSCCQHPYCRVGVQREGVGQQYCVRAPVGGRTSHATHVFGSSGDGAMERKGQDSFPFNEAEYRQVFIQVLHNNPPAGGQGGLLTQGVILMFDTPVDLQKGVETQLDSMALLLAIAGDTCSALLQQVKSVEMDRPLTVNLLSQVLGQAAFTQTAKWTLLRFAVVQVRDGVFIGRLFFGDPRTGRVTWDCDCRPSDGVWLAQHVKAPIYVHHSVWQQQARQLRTMVSDSPAAEPPACTSSEEATLSPAPAPRFNPADPWQVVPGEYAELALLKRKMQVAINEENYSLAARLRDEPVMMTYLQLHKCMVMGETDRAQQLEEVLRVHVDELRKKEREVADKGRF